METIIYKHLLPKMMNKPRSQVTHSPNGKKEKREDLTNIQYKNDDQTEKTREKDRKREKGKQIEREKGRKTHSLLKFNKAKMTVEAIREKTRD